MESIPDHPDIQAAELTGYGPGFKPKYPICPVCGAETDTFYKSSTGDIVGCEDCITTIDAWDEIEKE